MKKFSLLLIVVGVGMMAYTLYQFIPQFSMGQSDAESVKKALAQPPKTQASKQKKSSQPLVYEKRPKPNEQFGQLIIPKLKVVLPIYEGTDPEQLDKGVGHYAKSVLPGEADNSVLSGHRDTVFRRVGQLKKGDQLIVKTEAGQFTYKIKRTWIVNADDRSVIVSHHGKQILTLATCYPFNWIGAAPKRYIIQAQMVKT